MLRLITAIGLVTGAALAVSAACSDPLVVEGAPAVISNTWQEVGNPNHTFSLESADDGDTEGTFTGLEFVDAADQIGNPISGSWAQSRIQMTVTRHAGSTVYTATFTDFPDQFDFTFPGGTLTIRRQQQ